MVIYSSNSMTDQQLAVRSNRHYHGHSRFIGTKGELQHHKAAVESDESEDDELPVLPRQPIPVIRL